MTIADQYIQVRGEDSPSVRHLVSPESFEKFLAGRSQLTPLCGREVIFNEPVEPARTCSRCLGKAAGRQKRAATRR